MSDQLSFALNNPAAPGTVYVSTNAADNKLTLVITSTADASFTAGVVVPIDQADQGTGSLLYLDLSSLGLTEPEFHALTLDGTGWAFALYYSASSQVIGFTPTAPVSLSPADTIRLSLDNFTLGKMPPNPPVQLLVTYFRVGGVTQQNIPMAGNFAVSVTYPPDQHDHDLQTAVQVSLAYNVPARGDEDVHIASHQTGLVPEVVNSPHGSPLANNLMLIFSEGTDEAPPPASDTVFKLQFIYAKDKDGFGALMTPAQARPPGFAVTAGPDASGWEITPDTDAESPFWLLKPPTGRPIVDAGSTVSFNLTGLVTTFQPGPTVVLITYPKLPGYKAGRFAIPLNKVPHVEMTNFTVSPPPPVVLRDGKADVTLSWMARHAQRLTLHYDGLDHDVTDRCTYPPTTGTPNCTYKATITETTIFQLTAEGIRPGNVDNRVIGSCTATVQPLVPTLQLTATPSVVNADNPGTVQLQWKTTNASKLSIDGVGVYTGAQVASGSAPVLPSVTPPASVVRYSAEAYGLPSYSGPPALAQVSVKFMWSTTSNWCDVWNASAGILDSIKVGPYHALDLLLTTDDNDSGQHRNLAAILPTGVLAAYLGTGEINTTDSQIAGASYAPGPASWALYQGDGEYDDEETVGVSTTLALKFNDGRIVLLWYTGGYGDGGGIGDSKWKFTFDWTYYNPPSH